MYVYIYICIYIYIYRERERDMYVCMNVCIYIYIHTYTQLIVYKVQVQAGHGGGSLVKWPIFVPSRSRAQTRTTFCELLSLTLHVQHTKLYPEAPRGDANLDAPIQCIFRRILKGRFASATSPMHWTIVRTYMYTYIYISLSIYIYIYTSELS